MFACDNCTAIRASSKNMYRNSGSSPRVGKIFLMATMRSNPSTPNALAAYTSDMPPTAMRSRSRYFPNLRRLCVVVREVLRRLEGPASLVRPGGAGQGGAVAEEERNVGLSGVREGNRFGPG